jgi:hypothetical protein
LILVIRLRGICWAVGKAACGKNDKGVEDCTQQQRSQMAILCHDSMICSRTYLSNLQLVLDFICLPCIYIIVIQKVTVSDTANLTQEVSINQKKKIFTHTDSSRIVTLYVVFPDSQRLGTTTHCVRLRDCVLAGETGGEPGKYPPTLELEPLFLLLPAM